MLFVRLNPRLLFKWRQHRRRHAAHKPRDRAGQNLTHDAHLLLAATFLAAALLRAALLAAAGRALAARRFTRATLLARRLFAAAFAGRALLAGRFLRRLFPAS